MPVYQAIVLAIVQGFTEFLPVSSSAHLFLVPCLLGWPDQGLDFDIALHIGTLIAVLIYFFRDWLQILGQAIGQNWGDDPELKQSPRLLWYLVAASVPVRPPPGATTSEVRSSDSGAAAAPAGSVAIISVSHSRILVPEQKLEMPVGAGLALMVMPLCRIEVERA